MYKIYAFVESRNQETRSLNECSNPATKAHWCDFPAIAEAHWFDFPAIFSQNSGF